MLKTLVIILLFILNYSTGFSFDFGKKYGLFEGSSEISLTKIQQIQENAKAGKPEALYLLGLMMYYGHGLSHNEKRGISYFQESAEKGYAEAQFATALILYRSHRNDLATVGWLKKAVEQRHVDAYWLLGSMYNEGRGVEKDSQKAYELILKAVEAGHAYGYFHLGVMYEYGHYVMQDWTKAAEYYAKAAADDIPEAQYYLGLMIAYGRGFQQDFGKALTFFNQAAKHEYAPAMNMLGKMYTYGQGVDTDYSVAAVWFDRAANSENPQVVAEATQARNELTSLMNQVAERYKQVIDEL